MIPLTCLTFLMQSHMFGNLGREKEDVRMVGKCSTYL